MTVIPHQWRAYYARQAELDQRGYSNSTTWGIEAGLNLLLDHPSWAPERVTRAIAAGARRSRYANALLAKYIVFDAYRLDGVAAMEARSSLEKIRNDLPPATVAMLLSVACGEESDQMAAGLGVSVPTFQTRLSRGRSAAHKLAA